MPSIRSLMPERIEEARRRLAGVIRATPLIRSETLDRIVDAHLLIPLLYLPRAYAVGEGASGPPPEPPDRNPV